MGKLRDFVWWHMDRAWEGAWQAIVLGVVLSAIGWLTNSVFLAKLGASASVAFWGGIPLALVAIVSAILLRRQSVILGSRASRSQHQTPLVLAEVKAAGAGEPQDAVSPEIKRSDVEKEQQLPPIFPAEPNFENFEDFLDYRVQTEFRVSVRDRILHVEHDGMTQTFDYRKIKGTWSTSHKIRGVYVPSSGIRLTCGAVVYLVGVAYDRLIEAGKKK